MRIRQHWKRSIVADYDAPRTKSAEDADDDSLDELTARRRSAADTAVIDDDEAVDSFDQPDAEVAEELSVRVIPLQANEFTCSSCFLAQHRSRPALQRGAGQVCVDCV